MTPPTSSQRQALNLTQVCPGSRDPLFSKLAPECVLEPCGHTLNSGKTWPDPGTSDRVVLTWLCPVWGSLPAPVQASQEGMAGHEQPAVQRYTWDEG